MKTIEETTEQEALCLRVGRVAEMLDCSVSKVYDLVSDGHLEAIKLSEGKKAGLRILSSSLNRFLREGGVLGIKEMTLADKVNAQKPKYRRSSSEWF
jgi:excisionase family DNA binding protein